MTKQVEMSNETRAILTILIAEVQECSSKKTIKTLLDSWVKANDLHPEDVVTVVSLEKLREYINEI